MSDVCEMPASKVNSDEQVQTLRQLYDQALRRLAQREYGEEELRRKLHSYSDNSSDIETVINQMKQAGQLSDDRFIEAYIQARVRRGFGPVRICAELNEKGISNERLEAALSVWKSSWISLAKRVLEKKYSHRKIMTAKKNLHHDDKAHAQEKKSLMLTQKRFLLYRGFDHNIIQQTFSENS